jgi:hypothetical protein
LASPLDKNEIGGRLRAEQRTRALAVVQNNGRQYRWCRDRFDWEDGGLSAEDVHALVFERERRKARQLDRAHAGLATDSLPQQPRRDVIPRDVKRAVFEREGGRCVECGSNFEIQYDDIIRVALGRANTVANRDLQSKEGRLAVVARCAGCEARPAAGVSVGG